MSFFLQIFLITLGLLAMISRPAYALTNCQPIYGGGQSCGASSLALQKTVLNPQTRVYVHDLGLTDNKFMPGANVTFQLAVTNTGGSTITNVSVTDFLPDHMQYVTSNVPTSNSGTSNPTFEIGSLLPGQSKVILLTGSVAPAEQLGNNGSVCLINQAKAVADNAPQAADSSQICVFHPQTFSPPSPTTTQTIPGTGPSLFSTLLLPTAGALGFFLKKFEHKFTQKGGKN